LNEKVVTPVLVTETNSPVCAEQTLTFTSANSVSNVGNDYVWTGPGFTLPNTDQSQQFIDATVGLSGKYFLKVTDTYGCITRDTLDLLVNPLPLPLTANTSDTSFVCVGGRLDLSSTNTGVSEYNFYTWTGNAFPSEDGTDQNPFFTYATEAMSGKHYVVIEDNNGCKQIDSTVVLVNSIPIPSANDNTPVCAGQAINFFSEDTRTDKPTPLIFSWTGPASFQSNISNPEIDSAAMNMNGIYKVIIEDAKGCKDSTTTTVVVRSLPIPLLNYNSPVCVEDSIFLFSSDTRDPNFPNYTYDWRGPLAFTSAIQNPKIPESIEDMSGTYHLTMTDIYGCVDSSKFDVLIHSLPIPKLSYNPHVCQEDTLKLNVIDLRATQEPAYSYAWTGPLGFDTTAQGFSIPNSIVNMTGKYYVNVTDQYGCAELDSIDVIVHSLPIPKLSYNPNVCQEDTLKLNVIDLRSTQEPAYSYAWEGPLGFDTTAQGFSIPNSVVNMTGKYYVNVTDKYGCAELDSIDVIVHSLPIPKLSYNPNVCQEDTLKLNVIDLRSTQEPAYSYAWEGPLGFDTTAQGFSIPNSLVPMTGKYYVNVTDQYGCAELDSIDVIVHSLPIPKLSYNPNVCQEDTLKLNVIDLRSTQEPAYSYAWEGPLGFDTTAQGFSIPNSLVPMTGKYYVNVTDQYGCAELDSIDVIVHSLPIPKLSYNPNVCQEDTLKLNVVDLRNIIEPGNSIDSKGTQGSVRDVYRSAYTFAWTGPQGFDTTAQGFSIPNSVVNMTGKYYVNVTDQYGCAELDSIDVTVHSLPIPKLSYNPNVCQEDTLKLNVIDLRGIQEPAYSYAWEGPLGFDTTAQGFSIPNSFVNMTGKYYVNVTDQYGCAELDSIDVIVHSLPIPSANSNSPVCSAETLNLYASDTRNPNLAPYSYSWTGPNNYSSELRDPVFNSVDVSLSGIYEITITDNFGCSASGSTEVVNHHPKATAVNDGPYDEGENVNLLATGGTRFDWQGPNGFTSNLVNPTLPDGKTANSGIYSVTVTYQFCTATATTAVNVACNTPAMSYYLIYSDGAVPEVITPISDQMEIQKSTRPMTIVAIPACENPEIKSVKMHISGTTNQQFTTTNQAPFYLHENNGQMGGDVLTDNLYTFIARGFDEITEHDSALVVGPDIIQYWIVKGNRMIQNIQSSTQSICAGSTFTLSSDTLGGYSEGNIYQAFLSDINGKFDKPVLIGSSANPTSISCTIPNYINGGSNYKVMVRSSSPVVSSAPSSMALNIIPANYKMISPIHDIDNLTTSRKAIYTIDAKNKISGTSKVTFKAQYHITLEPGFEANSGTVFLAEMGSACVD
jgi:hypothetical protein